MAYTVNLLCKQAGLDVQYTDGEDLLPDCTAYLLPSLTGDAVPKRTWNALMEKVAQGATLYISWQDAILANFEKLSGMKVISNCMRAQPQVTVSLPGISQALTLCNQRRLNLTPYRDVEILGTEPDGNPAFFCHTYGKGNIYFLTFPMETLLADQPDAFENTDYYRLYRQMFCACTNRRILHKSSPQLAVTEHPADDNTCTVVTMNYGPKEPCTLRVQPGWTLYETQYGKVSQTSPGEILVEPAQNSICRFVLKHN